MKEKKGKETLIIGKYHYVEGAEDTPWLTGADKTLVEWFAKAAKKNNLFFDNEEELEEFRKEVCNFAVELYRKKHTKEETK